MEFLSGHLYFGTGERVLSEAVAESLRRELEAGDRLTKIRASLVCMRLAFENGGKVNPKPEKSLVQSYFQYLSGALSSMLDPQDLPCTLAAGWALSWIGERRLLVNPPESQMLLSLYQLWRQLEFKAQARYPSWALSSQKLLPRDSFSIDVWGDCESFLRQAASEKDTEMMFEQSALIVGWYRRGPWSDDELAERLRRYGNIRGQTVVELLENLGDAGRRVLEEWNAKEQDKGSVIKHG